MRYVTTIKVMHWLLVFACWMVLAVPTAGAGELTPRGGEEIFKTQRKGYTEFRIKNKGPRGPADVVLAWSDYAGVPQQRRIVLNEAGTTEYYENAFGGVSVRVTNHSQNARVKVTVSKSK